MSPVLLLILGAVLAVVTLVYDAPYPLHIMILILLWSFTYTSWAVMGRFGLVSLGHAASWVSAPTSRRCCGTTA